MEDRVTLTSPLEDRKIYSLSQLGESLKRTLEQVTQDRLLWFKAEIAKRSTSPSGHVYLELVEEVHGKRLAVMRGTLWKSTWMAVRDQLGQDAERIVDVGSEIVFSGRVSYHPVFGISLVLEEIDLHAILGEAEKRKQETIAFPQKQWCFLSGIVRSTCQGSPRTLPLLPHPALRGFEIFGMHLMKNDWGVGFNVEVFPTSVQGADAPAAIQLALGRAIAWRPDAIVMVRGGGSALDLDAFNSKDLCLSIAQSPIPVLTGIGHETDLSVADLVAHQHFKTPTAVADFLVDRLLQERTLLADLDHHSRQCGKASSSPRKGAHGKRSSNITSSTQTTVHR